MPSLAHRGFWAAPNERNGLPAFQKAFARGWGAELDVRDLNGDLVVSHDPPRAGALRLQTVVDAYRRHEVPGTLAVNVKADGLAPQLADVLRDLDPGAWFAFDMSIPDTLAYLRAGLPFFTRHSDIEPAPALYEHAGGVWLDDFGGGFIGPEQIRGHLAAGKRVAVVSPELHGRDHLDAWSSWSEWGLWDRGDVLLCTDHPDHAEEALT